MICEALQKLDHFGGVNTYRYVGFGSIYFADFILFHRSLNISSMISIEKDEDRLNRFTSNLPFRCVTLEPGASNDILPKLNWTKPTILWLDYDSRLKDNALTDIDFFCSNAGVGSVVIITVNSKPEPFPNPKPPGNFRLDQLKERVGEDNLPTYVTSDSDLNGWKMAKVCRDIITNKIEATLSGRNGVLPEEKRLLYKQLFHFNYSDGAEMLTVGVT